MEFLLLKSQPSTDRNLTPQKRELTVKGAVLVVLGHFNSTSMKLYGQSLLLMMLCSTPTGRT